MPGMITIVVVGPQESGKNTFIQVLSHSPKPRHRSRIPSHGFGELMINEDLLIHFYEAEPIDRQNLWEVQTAFMSAFVLVVDLTKPDTFAIVQTMLQSFLKLNPVPYVIAANRIDAPGAATVETLRVAIGVGDSVRIFPCNVTDHEADMEIILQLMYEILESYERSENDESTKNNQKPNHVPLW